MKLRVKAGAIKGHRVGADIVAPGGTLPGNYPGVPAGMGWKLEPVEEPVEEEPSRDDLLAQARSMGIDLPPGYVSKERLRELIREAG